MASVAALERGLGSITSVSAHFREALAADGVSDDAVREVTLGIIGCMSNELTRRALVAIIVAWQNTRFCETSTLHTVNDKGNAVSEYISTASTREAIAIMMAD